MKKIALLLVLTFGAVACSPKTATAPRVEVHVDEALSVRTFPRVDLSFNESQLFLWKKGFSDADVSRVLDSVGQLDALKERLFVMNRRWVEIKKQFSAIELDVVDLPAEEVSLLDKKADLAKKEAELAAMSSQPASEERDLGIEKLKKKIDRLRKQIETTDQKLAKMKNAGLESAYQERKDLEPQIASARKQADDALQPINETVWIFNSSPIRFHFSFDARKKVNVRIENWDLSKIDDVEVAESGASKDFSTEAFSIDRTSYASVGGAFQFEVYTPQAVYWFRVTRTKYGASDGRVYYKGDIVRCGVTQGYGRPVVNYVSDYVKCGVDTQGLDLLPEEVGVADERRGVASLVDRDDKQD